MIVTYQRYNGETHRANMLKCFLLFILNSYRNYTEVGDNDCKLHAFCNSLVQEPLSFSTNKPFSRSGTGVRQNQKVRCGVRQCVQRASPRLGEEKTALSRCRQPQASHSLISLDSAASIVKD